jgi:hypothetical protein
MADLIRNVAIREAIRPIHATTGHATTSVAVDATGWSRALWVIQAGAMDALAVLEMEVQESAASAGAYTDVTSAALTDIASTAGKNKPYFIDHAVTNSKPYLKIAGTCGTARATVSAICILYGRNGIVRDPYSSAGEIVDL